MSQGFGVGGYHAEGLGAGGGGGGAGSLDEVARWSSPTTLTGSRATIDDDGQLMLDGVESKPQLRIQPDNAVAWAQWAPADIASGHPPVDIRVTSTLLNDVKDQVAVFGHNAANGLANSPRWYLQLEYNFNVSAQGPIKSEGFFQWISADGQTVLRPIGCTVDWTNELCEWGFKGTGSWHSDAPSNEHLIRFDPGTKHIELVGSGTAIYKSTNNEPILYGERTDGSRFEMLRVDANNRINIDTAQAYNGVRINSGEGLTVGPQGVPNDAAILQSETTTQGWLPPRMTTAQKAAIPSPPAGLTVYDTTLSKLSVFTGAAWETVTST